MQKVYFIGEYGYCFRQLLPFLENYSEKLEIVTWEPICKIIDLLWRNKYITINANVFLNNINEKDRSGTMLFDKEKNSILENLKYDYISKLDLDKKFFFDNTSRNFEILKQKILYGEQKIEKPYVSVFPRGRKSNTHINNIGQEHIDWLKKKYPNKEIVGHGLQEERIQFNIRYCKDIYEQINVFNNSEVFICTASGLADLALMCGCDIILTYNYQRLENVNPHNCIVNHWENIKNV